ncbi:MAG TPA: cyanophycinase [Pirellula sp.]|nr:cyanophycinase [Pirellula sp.]
MPNEDLPMGQAEIRLPPGPTGSWRPTLQLIRNPRAALETWVKLYGDPFLLNALNGPVVVTGREDLIRTIHGQDPNIYAPFATTTIVPLMGSGSMLILEGDSHRRERRLIMPMFHGDRMKTYGENMQQIAIEHFEAHHSRGNTVTLDLMTDISLEVIVRTVFGGDDRELVARLISASRRVVASSNPLLFFSRKMHMPFLLTLRQRERFPGTLLLCGGGSIPLAIREEFYLQGKGAEGTLVLIPTASPRSDGGDFTTWIDYWSGFRWKNVEVLHVFHRDGAFDKSLVAMMQTATAVWLSGGDQQRLSDRFVGTPIVRELHELLARGGIVGGTSAGAAIASSTMIASGMIEPQFADGFQFLPKTIIDQHFTQKNRHGRLIKAIETYPDRTGIGIDESTGIFVKQHESKVFGDGIVYLFNADSTHSQHSEKNIRYRKLQAGEKLDTKELELSLP